jgi:hypothetical protein
MERRAEARTAANEATFREINEAIERGQWPGEERNPVGFRCECAQLGCNELLELTIAEYEGVRAYPRRFMVLPGHVRAGIEIVIDTRLEYIVVEKQGEAGVVAEETDPRR